MSSVRLPDNHWYVLQRQKSTPSTLGSVLNSPTVRPQLMKITQLSAALREKLSDKKHTTNNQETQTVNMSLAQQESYLPTQTEGSKQNVNIGEIKGQTDCSKSCEPKNMVNFRL